MLIVFVEYEVCKLLSDPALSFLSWHQSAQTCSYVVRIVCNAHAQVMEAENSITLTIYI